MDRPGGTVLARSQAPAPVTNIDHRYSTQMVGAGVMAPLVGITDHREQKIGCTKKA